MTWKRVLGLTAVGIMVVGVGAFGVAYAASDNDCDAVQSSMPRDPMRAYIYCDYGSAQVLRLTTLEKPVPTDSQVLVRVRATAVNPLDWHYLRGTPYVMRLDAGLRKPKVIRIGTDFAGTVEAVGRHVTQFKPGDEVFGARTGAFGQYITARADRVARKPANLTFEETAALPVAALTALQAVRDHAQVRPGQRVLINGASGGVGTFAVQIAKSLGAEVTGVSSTRNVALVRSLGADHVVDYTRENFTRGTRQYDVIIDNVGNHPLGELRRVLRPNGKYIMVGGPSGKWIDPLPRAFAAMVMSRFGSQELKMFLSQVRVADLLAIRDLVESGKVRPVIDRRYRMAELPGAVAYQEQGRARGKVVVTVD